jgi:formylglycine-generating enzyme required for sulfatase activity
VAAGYLSTQGKARVTAYIRALIDRPLPDDPYHNLVLAAGCLHDVGQARVAGDLWGEVTRRLLRDTTDERAPVRRRAAAGEALGQVGDPRFAAPYADAPCLVPEWAAVPAGPFWMGSESSEAYGDEKPVQRVTLPGFTIARYPVTNAEYQCFVEGGGYDERRYWTEAGWAWRHGEWGQKPQDYREEWWKQITARKNLDCPEGWEDRHHPPERANHPVVNVTWHEALAYCRWLGEQLRVASCELRVWRDGQLSTCNLQPSTLHVRLPSEAEWEKAARGDRDRREYPWGDRFDPARANTYEGDERVGGTTPVGIYPAGASPYGVEEMSGNVWEWTRSLWGTRAGEPDYRYPYDPQDGREDLAARGYRVVRGGSWLDASRDARCSFRLRYFPALWYSYLGFRLVVSLAFSDC